MAFDPFAQLFSDPRSHGTGARAPVVQQGSARSPYSAHGDASARRSEGAAQRNTGPTSAKPAHLDPFSRVLAQTDGQRQGETISQRTEISPKLAVESEARTARSHAGQTDGDYPDIEGEDFTLDDFVDIINPLHHLPLVGFAYRALTGDTISPHSRVMGGILFGGVTGGIMAAANSIAEQETGSDMGSQAMAFLFGEDQPAPGDGGQAYADAGSAPPGNDRITPFSALSYQMAMLSNGADPALSAGSNLMAQTEPSRPVTVAPTTSPNDATTSPSHRSPPPIVPTQPRVVAPPIVPASKPQPGPNAAVMVQLAEATAPPQPTATAPERSAVRTAAETAPDPVVKPAVPAQVLALAPERAPPRPELRATETSRDPVQITPPAAVDALRQAWRRENVDPPAMGTIADIMMRNLELYEQAARGERTAT